MGVAVRAEQRCAVLTVITQGAGPPGALPARVQGGRRPVVQTRVVVSLQST